MSAGKRPWLTMEAMRISYIVVTYLKRDEVGIVDVPVVSYHEISGCSVPQSAPQLPASYKHGKTGDR
jgi:hypothetical protein